VLLLPRSRHSCCWHSVGLYFYTPSPKSSTLAFDFTEIRVCFTFVTYRLSATISHIAPVHKNARWWKQQQEIKTMIHLRLSFSRIMVDWCFICGCCWTWPILVAAVVWLAVLLCSSACIQMGIITVSCPPCSMLDSLPSQSLISDGPPFCNPRFPASELYRDLSWPHVVKGQPGKIA
jgi:hypothetical protein